MLGDVVIEFIASVVGDVLDGWLFPRRAVDRRPLRDQSLGGVLVLSVRGAEIPTVPDFFFAGA
jgi:hypothetical protein